MVSPSSYYQTKDTLASAGADARASAIVAARRRRYSKRRCASGSSSTTREEKLSEKNEASLWRISQNVFFVRIIRLSSLVALSVDIRTRIHTPPHLRTPSWPAKAI